MKADTSMSAKERTILELYKSGTKPKLIASAANVSKSYVYLTLRKAKAMGEDVPESYRAGTASLVLRLRLPVEAMTRMSVEAARRKLTPEAFCTVLIQTIAAEDLYRAVLDDEEV